MPKHIRVYATFFASIGEGFSSAGELSQERLMAAYGAEGLRRQFQAARFVASSLGLDWDSETAKHATEQARVDVTLSRHADAPWAADLAAYQQSLVDGKAISPRTARMYVAAAADLLASSGVERAAALTEAFVMRHLRRKPGQGANLVRFLTWLAAVAGSSFVRPPKRTTTARRREKTILRQSASLLERLGAVSDAREGRALLAAAISCVHGVPLLHILALRTADVSMRRGEVRLRLPRGPVMLSGLLADGFLRFAAARGSYAFVGRNRMQPLSPAAVVHHLRPLGLPGSRFCGADRED